MRFIVIFTAFFSFNSVFAKSSELPMPPKGATMDTLEPLVQGVVRLENRVYLTLFARGMFIKVPFHGVTKDQKKSFGEFSESTRLPMSGPMERGLWQGGDVVGNRLVFLDGNLFTLAAFDEATGTHISSRTVPWDMLRPPRDRGGEATRTEVAEIRRRFKKAYTLTDSPRIAGLAHDRYRWLGKSSHNFFVATRIRGFPLLTLKCQSEDATACFVERACFVEGFDIEPEDIADVGVSGGKKIHFLDAGKKRIVTFDFRSCFHVTRRQQKSIPAKIKQPSGLYIDAEENLWITSRVPDDYFNASVYLWQGKSWQK